MPRRARPPGGLVVEPLVVHELPDAAEPGVAARARRGLGLEAVPAAAERVQVARDAHRAHLLPRLHGVHRGPAVRVAVDEESRKDHYRTAVQALTGQE